MLEGEVDRADYASYLAGLLPGIEALESAVHHSGHLAAAPAGRPRAALLAQDLATLRGGPVDLDAAHAACRAAAPRVRDPAVLLGIVYVLEGSRMGASLVLRRLERHGDPRAWPRRWLETQARGAAADWQRVRVALESGLREPQALAAAAVAACGAFATVALGVSMLDGGRPGTGIEQNSAS